MSSEEISLTSNDDWKPSASPWIISIAVMLATFMVVLDTSVANVALPHMAGSFSASSNEIMWVLTSYLIATGIILPSTAWFSSIFGRKNFLIICIIIFTAASIFCGAATSLEMMIFARILQGVGGGALMPISQAILLESFPKEQRGISMAVFGLGVVLAPVIGPTLGGWITDNYSWNWIFFINIPIGIIASIMTQLYVEDPPYLERGKIQKIDFVGFGALILWLVSLQVILDNGQKSDWFESAWVCYTAFISISAMIFFFVWEFKFKDSIIDLNVFKDRNFAVGTVLSMFVNAILYSTLAILPMFLQTLLGYTAYHSGMAITPRGIGCLATIGLAGYLCNKIDNRLLIAFGFLLLAISCFIFGNLNLTISMGNIIFPNIICGFALGFIFIPLATISFGTLSNEEMTNATGIQNLLKSIGGGIGVSIVSTMLSRMSQIHQANMVEHLNPLNPVFQQKVGMIQHHLSTYMTPVVAEQKANFLVYSSLLKQAALWSYIHNFRIYGILCLILIPTAFLFKNVKTDKTSAGSALH
jgi:DHA2 family multidrug resistance protein